MIEPQTQHTLELEKVTREYTSLYDQLEHALKDIERNSEAIIKLEKIAANLKVSLAAVTEKLHTLTGAK
jgi:chromosome segregation ATPase